MSGSKKFDEPYVEYNLLFPRQDELTLLCDVIWCDNFCGFEKRILIIGVMKKSLTSTAQITMIENQT